MNSKENDKKIIIISICILAVLIFTFSWKSFNKNEEQNNNSNNEVENNNEKISKEEIKYNNYIYKIKYDYLVPLDSERTIYLLPESTIKSVMKEAIYEIVPGCDCYEPTGEYNYKEETLNFSNDTKKEIINVFNELSKKSGSKEFDAKTMDLTDYQKKIFSAIIMNDEDKLTIKKFKL